MIIVVAMAVVVQYLCCSVLIWLLLYVGTYSDDSSFINASGAYKYQHANVPTFCIILAVNAAKQEIHSSRTRWIVQDRYVLFFAERNF